MELLSDKLEGLGGQHEAAARLRQLWRQAWDRTSLQVHVPTRTKGLFPPTETLAVARSPGACAVMSFFVSGGS